MLQLVCASANPDKVVEIGQLLGGVVDLRPRPAGLGEVIEDADTLTGNARLKATAVMEAAGLPAVADDTGLFVDVLDGAPGIYAARYAGDDCSYADNRRKLLGEMEGAANRRAEFRTVAIVVWPDGAELAVEGVCTGVITMFERGGDGFGYDPVFEPDEGGGATFAEMTAEAKNAISHRGRAFEALLSALSER